MQFEICKITYISRGNNNNGNPLRDYLTSYPLEINYFILQFREPASHCNDFEVTLKTPNDKNAILDKINSRRDKVASGEIRSLPSADRMFKLVMNLIIIVKLFSNIANKFFVSRVDTRY